VTIRDALSHRSGIGRGDLIWSYSGITRAEVLHRIRFLKPESPFRSKYSYQNIMVMAAGESAAKAGGSPWEDLVTQRIFVPLGMTSTIPTFQRLNTTNVAKPDAMNHDTAYTLPVFFPGADIAPAGAILSNVRDMAQWLRFQLNDGVVNGKRLVSSAALRETHTPQILTGAARVLDVDSVPLTNFSAYGLAWTIQDYRGQLMWTHGGNTTGMTTAVGIIPEKKFGVVVLSNMASAQLPAVLMRYIIDHHLGVKVRDLSAEAYKRTQPQRDRADSVEKAQAAEHKAGTVAPLPLETYAGTFADSMYGEAVVALKDGRLELTRGEQHGALVYWNANNFRWTPGPVGGSYIKFEITPDNRVTGMYWGSGADMDLLARKDAGGRGGRGARGGAGRGRQ
jgi:CubicO group peptidase (beta-lactamase class C family)